MDGAEPFHPLGEQPQGIIMYTPDGYMSAQWRDLIAAGLSRATGSRGRMRKYRAEVSSYFAYIGPFLVDEDRKTLTHSILVSLFPDWTGQTQPRVVELEGDNLHLNTQLPIKSGGKTVNSRLVWRRAERE